MGEKFGRGLSVYRDLSALRGRFEDGALDAILSSNRRAARRDNAISKVQKFLVIVVGAWLLSVGVTATFASKEAVSVVATLPLRIFAVLGIENWFWAIGIGLPLALWVLGIRRVAGGVFSWANGQVFGQNAVPVSSPLLQGEIEAADYLIKTKGVKGVEAMKNTLVEAIGDGTSAEVVELFSGSVAFCELALARASASRESSHSTWGSRLMRRKVGAT